MGTLHENLIYKNIKSLCDSHTPRISFSKMCVDLGLSKSLGTKLKENPDKNINGETAQMIANYFGVSVDQILVSDTKKETPTPNDGSERDELADLIERIKQADDQTLEMIRRVVGYK